MLSPSLGLLPHYGVTESMRLRTLILLRWLAITGQLVAITDQGHDLLRRMWPAYRASIQDHVGSKLNDQEMAKLAALLQRLL